MNKLLEENIEYYSNNDNYDIQDWYDGNFTIVTVLRKPDNEVVSVGVAKRNPACDKPDPERGYNIALARAIRAMDTWDDFEWDSEEDE